MTQEDMHTIEEASKSGLTIGEKITAFNIGFQKFNEKVRKLRSSH
jgi:hypothetical protein